MKEKSQAQLNKADAYIAKAVALGYQDAVQMSVIWPRFKAELQASIAKPR